MDQQTYDDKRTDQLNTLGFKVIRFWNNQLCHQKEAVLETIYQALAES